ncbi:MAG: hypothetical protein ACREJ0_10590 [Geminicoccaceae bacterium]
MQQSAKLDLTTDKRRRSMLVWRQGQAPHDRGLRPLGFVVEFRRESWRAAQPLSIGRSRRRNLTPLGNRDHARQRLPRADERAAGFSKRRGSRAQNAIDINRAEDGSTTFVPQVPQPSQNIHWLHLFRATGVCLPQTVVQMRNCREFARSSFTALDWAVL